MWHTYHLYIKEDPLRCASAPFLPGSLSSRCWIHTCACASCQMAKGASTPASSHPSLCPCPCAEFAVVRAPDVYGVFQFKVNYWRPGYGSISVAEEVLVRPFRHDEFERFIPAAYPYYASTFSMMVGSFVLGAVVLYHKPIPKAPSKA